MPHPILISPKIAPVKTRSYRGVLPSFHQLTLVYSPATHAHLLRALSTIRTSVPRKNRPRNPATGPDRESYVCRTPADGRECRRLAGGQAGQECPRGNFGGESSPLGGELLGNYLRRPSGGTTGYRFPRRPGCEVTER